MELTHKWIFTSLNLKQIYLIHGFLTKQYSTPHFLKIKPLIFLRTESSHLFIISLILSLSYGHQFKKQIFAP